MVTRDRKRRDIGLRIKSARRAKGLRQFDLAGYLGVNRVTVTVWELGQVAPRNDHLSKLSEVLGQPVTWFLLPIPTCPHCDQPMPTRADHAG